MEKKRVRNCQQAYVYVMLSVEGLVKVGISQNIITRAEGEAFEGEKKKIKSISYSAEKFDLKIAKIYEAALLGFHRRYIINGSEWLATKWENVVKTLNNMLDSKTFTIEISENGTRQDLNDQYMKNKGYTRKYLGKYRRFYFYKCENNVCALAIQTAIGEKEKEICTLSVSDMEEYLSKYRFEFIKELK